MTYSNMFVAWASATAWRCFPVDLELGKVEALRSGLLIVGQNDQDRAALYYWACWGQGKA